jgi:hypothetical protein
MSASDGEEQIPDRAIPEANGVFSIRERNGGGSIENVDLTGVVFITRFNEQGLCYLPSTQNYFENLQLKLIIADNGCFSLLLAIENLDMLLSFPQRFPSTEYTYNISSSPRNGGLAPVQIIRKYANSANIQTKLCQDIVGSGSMVMLPYLRFALCGEDMVALLNNPVFDHQLKDAHRAMLQSSLLKNPDRPRRRYSLIGRRVLARFACVRCDKIAFYVDPQLHRIVSWNDIRRDSQEVDGWLRSFPEFDNAELQDLDSHEYAHDPMAHLLQDYW